MKKVILNISGAEELLKNVQKFLNEEEKSCKTVIKFRNIRLEESKDVLNKRVN
jgi:hypothetical protein